MEATRTCVGGLLSRQEIQTHLPMDIRIPAVRGFVIAALWTSVTFTAKADDLALADGSKLSGVTIMRFEPDGLAVRSATGIQTKTDAMSIDPISIVGATATH